MYTLGPVESSNAIRPNKQRVLLRVLVVVGSLLPCTGAFGQWVVESVDATENQATLLAATAPLVGTSTASGARANAIVNGDFEKPFEEGWGIDGVDGLLATVTRVTYCDNDPDYEARVHRYALAGTTRLYQAVPISNLQVTLSFKARLRPSAGPLFSAAVVDVAIGYFDDSDNLLGRTDHLRTTYGTWPSTDTEHRVWVADGEWHEYSFVIADELGTHLTGVDPDRVAQIKIVVGAISTGLAPGTAEVCTDDFYIDAPPGVAVSNVRAQEDPPTSSRVLISYDLRILEQETATVWLQIDGGSETWDVPVDSTTGDIGPSVTPGIDKKIMWDAGADIPCQFGDQFVARVVADGSSADSAPFTIWAGKVLVKTPDLSVPRGGEAEITATLELRCDGDPSDYSVTVLIFTPSNLVVPDGEAMSGVLSPDGIDCQSPATILRERTRCSQVWTVRYLSNLEPGHSM